MTPRSMDKTASWVSDERLVECLTALSTERVNDAHALNFGWHELRSILTELQSLRSLSDSVSDGSKGVGQGSVFELYATDPDGAGKSSYLYDHYKRGAAGIMEPKKTAVHAHEAWRAGRHRAALDSGTGGQQPVAYPAAWMVRENSQDHWDFVRLKKAADDLLARGYEVVPLYPSPTEPKAGVVSEDMVDRAAKRICLATGLDWDSIDDVGPDDHSNNSGDETKGWFRYLARAALPNTTGEAE